MTFAASADALVYWANSDPYGGPASIGRGNLNGSSVYSGFIGLPAGHNPCGVAVDAGHLYWGDTDFFDHSDQIGRARVDGTQVNAGFIPDLHGSSCGLAIDGSHIYWTSSQFGGTIGRANLDGTGVDESLITGVDSCSVAVDGSHVYWASARSGGEIGRANLNGTSPDHTFIHAGSTVDECGLAVDAGHIYWASASATGPAIGRANLNGTGVDPDFIPLKRGHPCGVAVNASHIFWANNLEFQSISRAKLDGTGVRERLMRATRNRLFQPCGVALDSNSLPPNRFELGEPELNRQRGTAALPAKVPGPGELVLKGKGLRKTTRNPGRAKKVRLLVEPTGETRRTLDSRGHVRVTAVVTYKPTGGDPRRKHKRLELIKN